MSVPTIWKILVAEDRAGIFAALLAGRDDFEVTAAHRLQAAERLLRDMPDPPFQAVLLDMALADIADPMGLDAFRRVRAMAPGLPVVALVPAAAEEAALALAAAGAAACLPRQSTPAEVLAWTLRQAVLRAANETRRYRELFESVPVGILLAAGRRVAMANPAALDQLGYSAEELSRASVLDLFAPSLRAGLESALDASGTGEVRETGFRADLIRKDGTAAPARVIIKGARLNDAPALAFYLSPSPGKEAASPDHGPKMEALARMAEGIAHDFNNLFTAINGYSDHLLSLPGAGSGAMSRGLNAIRKAGEAATAMIRGLAAFGHPGSGEPQAIPVDAVIGGMAPGLGALPSRARLDVRAGAGAAEALLEPGQLEQIVLCLCANAAESGTAAISLDTGTEESARGEAFTHLRPSSPGPYVVLSVRDSGRGLSGEEVERLFEPHFPARGGRRTGDGLAAVYGIVSRAGGGISVWSRPGQGSRFSLWLPRAEPAGAEGDADAAVDRAPSAGAGAEAAGAGSQGLEARGSGSDVGADKARPRVTVVEDEPTMREMLRAVLERYGYEVSEAGSGEEAEACLPAAGQAPDLLLTDVQLRDGLGTELAERLRATHPGLRTLFISGHSLEILLERGIDIAPEEFLEKPFTPSQLAEKVGARLGMPAGPVGRGR